MWTFTEQRSGGQSPRRCVRIAVSVLHDAISGAHERVESFVAPAMSVVS
jgi:hypothetical protein